MRAVHPLASPLREQGVVVLVALLALAALSSLAAGLALSATLNRTAAANFEESIEAFNAADSALDFTIRELAAVAAWDDVLSGARVAGLADGPPGLRVVGPGEQVDLAALTNEITCGRPAACTNAQIAAYTAERPWGPNNPRWRLFLSTWMPDVPVPRRSARLYVAAWIGDDGREIDGNSDADDAVAGGEGRYMVRARVYAFGSRGGRAGIEAELTRMCTADPAGEICRPGVRIHGWRVVP
jgi:hypothetical protein